MPAKPLSAPSFHTRWDANRYPRSILLACYTESKVQSLILSTLHRAGIPCWPIDAGAKKLRAQGYDLTDAATPVPEDWPDITGYLPGKTPGSARLFFIEVKRPQGLIVSRKTGKWIQAHPAGEPTIGQVKFLREQGERGVLVGIAWALSDALDLLRPHHAPLGRVS